MKKFKDAMPLRQMIENYARNYCSDDCWNFLFGLTEYGLNSPSAWSNFTAITKGWVYCSDLDAIVDSLNNDECVAYFTDTDLFLYADKIFPKGVK